MKYKHLTAEQRNTIDVLLRQKKSRKEIAQTIGVSQSTLCREIKRNSGQRGYHWQQAHVKAADRQRRLQNYRNLTLEIRNFIRTRMCENQWSPAQIVGCLRKKGMPAVCVETIYAYIRHKSGQREWRGSLEALPSSAQTPKASGLGSVCGSTEPYYDR